MSYTVMILVEPTNNHYKFWSYNMNDGMVAWGRIGTSGTVRRFPDSVIRERAAEKRREGYRVLAEDANYYSPSEIRVREFLGQTGGTTSARPARLIPTTPTTPRTRSSTPRATRISIPSVEGSYKTDAQGFIKKYRSGYKRNTPSSGNEIKYKLLAKEDFASASMETINKAKKFYSSIPINMVAKKRPFGFVRESEQIFGRKSGKFRFVVDEEGKYVGAFEINTAASVASLFYAKTNAENYSSLVKFMLESLGGTNRINSQTVIMIKGTVLKKIMKDMFDWQDVSLRNGITYFSINTRDLISVTNQSTSSERFQELMW